MGASVVKRFNHLFVIVCNKRNTDQKAEAVALSSTQFAAAVAAVVAVGDGRVVGIESRRETGL